jgi:hypothetical protein
MNAGPIRGQYLKISYHLPKDLKKAIQSVAFFEFHEVGVREALERKENHATHAALQSLSSWLLVRRIGIGVMS